MVTVVTLRVKVLIPSMAVRRMCAATHLAARGSSITDERRKDLVQERVNQRGQYLVDNIPLEALKGAGDGAAPQSLGSALGESYIEGRCEIHVHFRAGTVEGRILGDWCAAVKPSEKALDFFRADSVGHEERQRRDIVECGRVGQSVLFHVREFIKLPEGIAVERLPSAVRLQSLDGCLRSWADAPNHIIEFPQRPGVGALGGVFIKDREPRIALGFARQRPFRTRQSELESEVVEGGAEVVDAVSGDEAEARRRRLDDFSPNDLLASLGIKFGPESMRAFFKPGSPFRFKVLQVIERPVEPPFVGTIHG